MALMLINLMRCGRRGSLVAAAVMVMTGVREGDGSHDCNAGDPTEHAPPIPRCSNRNRTA